MSVQPPPRPQAVDLVAGLPNHVRQLKRLDLSANGSSHTVIRTQASDLLAVDLFRAEEACQNRRRSA